jgi:protease I
MKRFMFKAALIICFSFLLLASFNLFAEGQSDEPPAEPRGEKILMIIASRNFRDEELKTPKSLFEHYGYEVVIASSTLSSVQGMLGMETTPDILIDDVHVDDYVAVVFVGGSGATEYYDNPEAHRIALETINQGKVLAAICLAPNILAKAGLLSGKKATCYNSDILINNGADYTGSSVERDGLIITGNGPGAAEEFAEAILNALLLE